MTDTDEHLLIAQARDDPAAFAALYERYIRRIYGFVFRQTQDTALTQDITSITFERALRHLRRYQWRGVSFGAWLYKIARNEMALHFRRKAVAQVINSFFPLPGLDLEQAVQAQQQLTILYTALSHLSKADRDLIGLRFFEELSPAEIAEILGCSVQNVYVRLHRALSRLRKQLDVLEREEKVYVSE
jgi:RNA polymerase sigma-70 factor, ECF subfamily